MEDEDTLDSSADKLPELPTSEESLPNFPDEPVELPTDSPSLPVLPGDDTEELPDLPGLDEAPNSVDSSPLLPGEESDDIGLPPLPGGNDGGLPLCLVWRMKVDSRHYPVMMTVGLAIYLPFLRFPDFPSFYKNQILTLGLSGF